MQCEGGMNWSVKPPMSELEKNQVVRLALERVAAAIERKAGNKVYMAAWKIAAKIVREMKPN